MYCACINYISEFCRLEVCIITTLKLCFFLPLVIYCVICSGCFCVVIFDRLYLALCIYVRFCVNLDAHLFVRSQFEFRYTLLACLWAYAEVLTIRSVSMPTEL